ncbi:MAG: nucleotidyltransferase [Christensenella sp.]|nr:nucleotidyltransferase [Christensenella sp.]
MKIAGITAEYNPFHQGHQYHILQTSKKSGAEAIICIMSGNFTQRGEPAVFDKWSRAKAAVLGGADLVLELPFAYAVQSAEQFAFGAVSILDKLNCVSCLSFGMENGSLNDLTKLAHFLAKESQEYSYLLKNSLDTGLSYPAARAAVLSRLLPEIGAHLYSSPNNILALEYLKAIETLQSSLQPVSILRCGGAYHDKFPHKTFASATALRRQILDCGIASVSDENIPLAEKQCYANSPVFPSSLYPYAAFRLRQMSISKISKIFGVSEGLEYKIFETVKKANSYDTFISMIKSKRYPHSRLQRLLLYCFMGITKEQMTEAMNAEVYARVLCIKKEKLWLLSYLSKHASIPLITKAAQFPQNNPLFDLDLKASDLYGLLGDQKKIAPSRRDFIQKLMII